MVSDVDSTVAKIARESKPAARAAPAPAPAGRARSAEAQEPERPVYQAPAHSSGGSSTGKWLLGIGAVAGLLWLVSQSGDKPQPPSPAPVFTPSGNSSSVASPSPSWQPATSPPLVPSRPSEEKPPVGTNNVLTSAQLRYCVAEQIRLDAAKGVINSSNDTHVDRFNEMVGDYNGRCGQFRYRSGALEGARAEVERFREALESDGRARFVQGKAAPSQDQTFVPLDSTPDPTVKAVQERLNELGYDVGPADGLMGGRTRAAIVAFQRNSGLTVDGAAGSALLLRLQQATVQAPAGANDATNRGGLAANSAPPRTAARAPLDSAESPNTSAASPSERASIENACGYHKRINGPADYNRCVNEELSKLARSKGMPDLSRASASERASIENACGYHKRINGPADYYHCVNEELTKLARTQGMPDISRASASERSSIENACGYHKRINGPADYYRCVTEELSKLAGSQGMPDLSRASASERASIESACGYHKRINGPADYYRCVSEQVSKLGYR